MLGWMIVIVLLLLILLLPVGIDAAYASGALTLKLKTGPIRIQLLPAKKKKKPKQRKEKPTRADQDSSGHDDAGKLRLGRDDVLTLLRLVLRTLRRFRKHLSVDLLRLYWIAAAEDPYDAAVQYGAMNAALTAVIPLAESVLKIREKDVRTDFDFEARSPVIDARAVATLQVWEILFIVLCAGAAAVSWYLGKRKQARIAAKADAEKGK